MNHYRRVRFDFLSIGCSSLVVFHDRLRKMSDCDAAIHEQAVHLQHPQCTVVACFWVFVLHQDPWCLWLIHAESLFFFRIHNLLQAWNSRRKSSAYYEAVTLAVAP